MATIASRAAEEGIPFLLAGGHAVIIHGFARSTFDLDLIVRQSDRAKWLQVTQDLGYQLHHQGASFAQFNATKAESFPLDLMLVNDQTFLKLDAEAVPAPPNAPGVRAVSLLHLLALKCHAVKHGHAGRILKDAEDVVQLIQKNKLDPESARSATYLKSMGQKSSTRRSGKPASPSDSPELEFPDWSGMDDSTSRITPEAAFRLCEKYLVWFPHMRRQPRPVKCTVEFVL